MSNFASLDYMKGDAIINDWSLANEEEHKVSKRKAKIIPKTKQPGAQVKKKIIKSRLLLKKKIDIATQNSGDIA